jgi:diguanylate cyclase (GGDEF)-like protein
MNLIARRDRALLAGLAIALFVVFARPVAYLLDVARQVEESSGLALVPALVILTVVFLFHQQSKRQEAKLRAVEAEANASQAHMRAVEMERMVNFGQALGRSLDLDTIRDVTMQYLPTLAGTEDVWVLLRTRDRWQALVATPHQSRQEIERSRIAVAEQAVTPSADGGWRTDPIDGQMCLRLAAGGHTVGVLGIPAGTEPLSDTRQRVLETAAALLAITVRNVELFREVKENSVRDGLTGCFNRTHASELIDIELRRAHRTRLPVSLIMFDLDHFKDINDRRGHQCGDSVLAAVGTHMRDTLRVSDVKVRYGGEEFLVLLPETSLEGATRVAETLRRGFADLHIACGPEPLNFTASFGVAVARVDELDRQSLIARADAALYRAKEDGRNCIRLSPNAPLARPIAVGLPLEDNQDNW